MNGVLAKFAVYNRALTQRDAAQLYRDPWIGLRGERALVEV